MFINFYGKSRDIQTYLIALFSVLFAGCSSGSNDVPIIDEEPEDSNLQFSIEMDKDTFGVDEIVSFTVKANENLKEICVSYDDWSTSSCFASLDDSGIGETHPVRLSFMDVGTRTINVKVENYDGVEKKTKFDVPITKENTITIKKIRMNSFKNMGESWDPEFPDSDKNRLADLVFAIQKEVYGISFDKNKNRFVTLIVSDILNNQGNLTWDLTNKNLVMSSSKPFKFGLVDYDGPDPDFGGIDRMQDLLMGPPTEVEFNFEPYILERPSEVTFKKENIDLEVVFEIEWN